MSSKSNGSLAQIRKSGSLNLNPSKLPVHRLANFEPSSKSQSVRKVTPSKSFIKIHGNIAESTVDAATRSLTISSAEPSKVRPKLSESSLFIGNREKRASVTESATSPTGSTSTSASSAQHNQESDCETISCKETFSISVNDKKMASSSSLLNFSSDSNRPQVLFLHSVR